LPMVDLIEQCQMACDELIDVAGRAAIQAVLGLSAVAQRTRLARFPFPKHPPSGTISDDPACVMYSEVIPSSERPDIIPRSLGTKIRIKPGSALGTAPGAILSDALAAYCARSLFARRVR
jgi:hypothetical protein